MTVRDKFIGREVTAKRGLGTVRGVVVDAHRIWSGNWRLLVAPKTSSVGFWVNSRKCRVVAS